MSPDYSWAYFNLGAIFFEEGETEKAKEYLLKTLELNPKDDNASIILAKIYAKEDKFNDGINLLKKALQNNPYNGDVHYTIANFYKQVNDTKQYLHHLKEAMNNYQTLSTDIKQLQFEYEKAQ